MYSTYSCENKREAMTRTTHKTSSSCMPSGNQDGFEKLVTQINIGVMYAQYINHPIPDQEMVDTFIMVIMKCGLFNTSYEKWHAHPDRKKHGPKQQFSRTRR